mmetsp:Transcript_4776/g.5518  ORF Transcript_4776/g.5518 Transcript_4776/m.5518 type:complete len:94 (+) Transcript_4776:791-1072(+)
MLLLCLRICNSLFLVSREKGGEPHLPNEVVLSHAVVVKEGIKAQQIEEELLNVPIMTSRRERKERWLSGCEEKNIGYILGNKQLRLTSTTLKK